MADPDLELMGGGGRSSFTWPTGLFPSVISSFFTENKGGRAPTLDPPLVTNC